MADESREGYDWLVFLESHLRRAEDAYASQPGNQAALVALRKVGGLALSMSMVPNSSLSFAEFREQMCTMSLPPRASLGEYLRLIRMFLLRSQNGVELATLTAVMGALRTYGAPRREVLHAEG